MLDRRLAQDGADVVFVGNSKVATDIDWTVLRGAFPGVRTSAVNVFGSVGPTWYAVLNERVYGGGYHPRRVVVYGTIEGAMATGFTPPAAALAVVGQLGDTAPEPLARLFGGWSADAHARWAAALRPHCDAAKTPLPALPPQPTDRPFLGELVATAKAHGSTVVFVRQPTAPGGTLQDDVSIDVERRARAFLRDAGGAWIDLRHAPLTDEAWYGDGVHMNAAGRSQLTAALIDALRGAGAMGDGPLPTPADPAAPPVLTWDGGPAPLAATFTTSDCRATTALPAGVPLPDTLAAAGLGAWLPLEVRVGDRVLHRGAGATCDNGWDVEAGRIVVRTRGRPTLSWTGPSVVAPDGRRAWAVPPGGAVVVDREGVTVDAGLHTAATATGTRITGGATWSWVTRAAAAAGPLLDDGPPRWDLVEGSWTFGPTPALPGPLAVSAVPGRPELLRGELGAVDVPGDDAAFDASGVGACAPLRLAGVAVNVHAGGFTLTSRDCAALPVEPVRFALATDRACPGPAHARWLYPGDTATVRLDGAAGPATRLRLAGGVVGAGDGQLAVSVRAGGVEVGAGTSPLAAFATGPVDVPVRGGAGPIEVTLRSSGGPWLLLSRVDLEGT